MWKYLLFLLVLFLTTVSCNLLALGVQIYCDFWLMGNWGSSPSISLRVFLWRVSQAYLRPMEWLGGYSFNHFVEMCLIEAVIVAIWTYIYVLFRRTRTRRVG